MILTEYMLGPDGLKKAELNPIAFNLAALHVDEPSPRVFEQWDTSESRLNVGDIVTIAGVRPRRRWWQFWRWFNKLPELQQFRVTSAYPGLSTEPIDIHKELYK